MAGDTALLLWVLLAEPIGRRQSTKTHLEGITKPAARPMMRARRETKVMPIMMSSVRRLMWLLKYLLCGGRKLL